MSIRIGIVGVSGYGGGEVLRICATHPTFELVYVAGAFLLAWTNVESNTF